MLNVDSFYVAFTIAREAAIQFKSAHSLRKFKFTSRFGERIFWQTKSSCRKCKNIGAKSSRLWSYSSNVFDIN